MKIKATFFYFITLLLLAVGQQTLNAQKIGEKLEDTLGVYQIRTAAYAQDGYINLRIVKNRFHLYFLAADQQTIVKPDLPIALVQYGNAVQKNRNRINTKLTLAPDGSYLIGVRFISPPLRYHVRVILINNAEEEAVNSPINSNIHPKGAKKEVFKAAMLNQLV